MSQAAECAYTQEQIDKAHEKAVREIIYRTLEDALALGKADAAHFKPMGGPSCRWNPDVTLQKARTEFVKWVAEPVFHRFCTYISADPKATQIFLLEVALKSAHLIRLEQSLERMKWEARVYGAKGPKKQEK